MRGTLARRGVCINYLGRTTIVKLFKRCLGTNNGGGGGIRRPDYDYVRDEGEIPKYRQDTEVKNYWENNRELMEKGEEAKRKDRTHYIFLDGPDGCGKSALLSRLKHVGFTVYSLPIHDFTRSDVVDLSSIEEYSNLSRSWSENLVKKFVEPTLNEESTKKANKHNIIVISPSLISPYIKYKTCFESEDDKHKIIFKDFVTMHNELRQKHSVSLVICKADPIVIKQRLAERYYLAHSDKEKQQREFLGEVDESKQSSQIEFYDSISNSNPNSNLNSSSHINNKDDASDSKIVVDAVLNTTSVKQSMAALQKMLNITHVFMG